MLSLLHIENVAVIESVDITFDNRLNVLTGETGAGKSIIIDALGAILGSRASRELIRSGCDRASVRAMFHEPGEAALAWLSGSGIAFEDELIISRDILTDGRNICKIAGNPATVAQLRQLGELLVHVHGQHDSQSLLQDDRHLGILDSFGAVDTLPYREMYNRWSGIKKAISALSMDDEEKSRRIDMLTFRLNEIDAAAPNAGEEAELAEKRKRLQNAEKIKSAADSALACLSGGDDAVGAASLLSDAAAELRSISAFGQGYEDMSKKLDELAFTLEDLVDELMSTARDDNISPRELDAIETRLDVYYRLKRKYNCTIEELIEKANGWRGELEGIQLSEERLKRLEAEKKAAESESLELAGELSARRAAAAAELTKRMADELSELDMGKARFEVAIMPKELSGDGSDEVSFRFSANPGEELKPLSKVASGGELARIMLAIKNIRSDDVPTLIFDEVDSGVSGRAAQKVAQKLCAVSRRRQVLCVTHLAQIAAMGDTHFLIEKGIVSGRTVTTVERLDSGGRASEIARLTGGSEITETTIQNAAELIGQADAYKKQ